MRGVRAYKQGYGLKKIVIIIVFAIGAYQFANKGLLFSTTRNPINASYPAEVYKFNCDGRQYCSQMKSRAEAEFFIRNCPNTKMDGDHDGIPCENDSRW